MSDHAKLAPSAAHRWLNCPGSVRACEPYPETDSEYAREGTFAHELAARCLTEGTPAWQYVGAKSAGGEFVVDHDMAAAVQVYVDAVSSLAWLRDGELYGHAERRVSLRGIRDDIFGTADYIGWSDARKHLDVFDYKHGAGVFVSAEKNPQLAIYGLGALCEWPGFVKDVERVSLHIVQPRHAKSPQKWRTWETTAAELRAFGDVVAAGAARTEDPAAPLVAGEWCTFCAHKANCSALRDLSLDTARNVFENLDTLEPRAEPVPADQLTPEQTANVLHAAPLVRKWLDAVEKHAHNLASSGHPPPGWKLVRKTGNRTWIDEKRAEAALVMAGIDPRGPRPLLSPVQAQKKLGKGGAKIVDPLCTKPSTGSALVEESDSRPALVSGGVFDLLD